MLILFSIGNGVPLGVEGVAGVALEVCVGRAVAVAALVVCVGRWVAVAAWEVCVGSVVGVIVVEEAGGNDGVGEAGLQAENISIKIMAAGRNFDLFIRYSSL
jgi:hypothetical protein